MYWMLTLGVCAENQNRSIILTSHYLHVYFGLHIPSAEQFWFVIMTDPKIMDKGTESRNMMKTNHVKISYKD